MPTFYLHFNDGRETYLNDMGVEFSHLEQAYLEVCAAIPGIAQDLLIKRQNPLAASHTIADGRGRVLMTVPFTDVLSASEWRLAKARQRPHGGPRSTRARDDLALASFRRMFGSANAGCVLMTPDMHILEMNEFGARHGHVDAEAIRGLPIFEIFSELRGEPKADFDKFMSLAQAGMTSEVVDLPYLVLGTAAPQMVGGTRAHGPSSTTTIICSASSSGRSLTQRQRAGARRRLRSPEERRRKAVQYGGCARAP